MLLTIFFSHQPWKLLKVWWYSLKMSTPLLKGPGSQGIHMEGERCGEGPTVGGRGEVGVGGLWVPRCASPRGELPYCPCLGLTEADSPAAVSCVLSWNSYYVTGIQLWPAMKLQTAGSSLA